MTWSGGLMTYTLDIRDQCYLTLIRIVDQDGRLLDFREEEIIVRLHVQKCHVRCSY